MKDFLWVDPQDLLPRDRGLLEENFNSMGSSPAACELWIAAMEVAVSAAEHARGKLILPLGGVALLVVQTIHQR